MPQGQQTTEDVLKRLARMGLSMPSKSAPPPAPSPQSPPRKFINQAGTGEDIFQVPQGPLTPMGEMPASFQQESYPPGVRGTLLKLFLKGMDFAGGMTFQDPLHPEASKETGAGGLLGALLPVAGAVKAAKGGRQAIKTGEKLLTKQQMLERWADGYLARGVEMEVPLAKVDGLEPTPSGDYRPGRQITQPIEVAYDSAQDKYMLYSGNHRVTQAKMNGQATIPAFVEPDAVSKIVAPMPSHAPTQAGGTLAQAMEPIKAYHGSPHDFDKFSLEKIGTGEGAQAYGHGLYFAENPSVAHEYRVDLTRRPIEVAEGKPLTKEQEYMLGYFKDRNIPLDDKSVHSVGDAMTSAPFDVGPRNKATWDKWKNQWEDLRPRLTQTEQPGRTYEVGLHASPDDFLDWDKPLSQQSEKVRKALRDSGIVKNVDSSRYTPADLIPRGEGLGDTSRADASEAFRKAGIKGIRYLDQGSRGMPEWRVTWETSKGRVPTRFGTKEEAEAFLAENKSRGALSVTQEKNTSNYVVFDEDIIEIRKKFLAMLAAGAGAAAAKQAAEAKNKKKGG